MRVPTYVPCMAVAVEVGEVVVEEEEEEGRLSADE
jgi:hypothetical protein